MQGQNQTPRSFTQRTDALQKALRTSLVDVAEKIGISKATLFANRSGNSPISDKTWRALDAAERAAGLRPAGDYPSDPVKSAAVNEGAGSAPSFVEWLALIRGCREEAEKLGGGDATKTREIFDRILEATVQTLSPRISPEDQEEALRDVLGDRKKRA